MLEGLIKKKKKKKRLHDEKSEPNTDGNYVSDNIVFLLLSVTLSNISFFFLGGGQN